MPRRLRRPVRSPVAVAVAALAMGSTAGATAGPPGSGAARRRPHGDGSKPLPGYTVSNPPLAPLSVAGAPTRVVQGIFDHAAFDLEVPTHWNGQLVMWAHGYRGQGTVLTVDPPAYGLRQTFADEGYAWAASSYTDNGYDVASGVLSEHALALHAIALLHRRPARTYIGTLAQNPGRLARNLFTRYAPNTPVDVNATIQRVVPTDLKDRLSRQLSQVPRIAGDPRVPVLSLHGLGDMFVPFSMEEIYAHEVARHGESALLVQRAVREAGHCEYTPTEVGTACTDLQKRVRARGHRARLAARPAGDVTTDPAAVASSTYGCQFTDQGAYADPADFPTRALFARCPAA